MINTTVVWSCLPPLLTVGSGASEALILFVCPSVNACSVWCDLFTKWTDFAESCQRYSSREWKLQKRRREAYLGAEPARPLNSAKMRLHERYSVMFGKRAAQKLRKIRVPSYSVYSRHVWGKVSPPKFPNSPPQKKKNLQRVKYMCGKIILCNEPHLQ